MPRYDVYFGRGPERGRSGSGPWRYDRGFGPGPGHVPYDRQFQQERGYGDRVRYRSPATGYDRDFGHGARRPYDQFAREPFTPVAAYRRHPEPTQPRLHRSERWPAAGHDLTDEVDFTDEQIRGGVLATMEEDSWIISDQIEVTVEDGVVTLRGEVGDYMEARYAWDDTWETEGVRGVINHLTVRT